MGFGWDDHLEVGFEACGGRSKGDWPGFLRESRTSGGQAVGFFIARDAAMSRDKYQLACREDGQ